MSVAGLVDLSGEDNIVVSEKIVHGVATMEAMDDLVGASSSYQTADCRGRRVSRCDEVEGNDEVGKHFYGE